MGCHAHGIIDMACQGNGGDFYTNDYLKVNSEGPMPLPCLGSSVNWLISNSNVCYNTCR